MVIIHRGPLPTTGLSARYDVLDSAILQSHVLEPSREIIFSFFALYLGYVVTESNFVVNFNDTTEVSQASGIMLDSGLLGEAEVRLRWRYTK